MAQQQVQTGKGKGSQRDQVQKGLQHLKGSDKIIGDIIGYCVQAYKADSSQTTIEKVRKYVEDTANSVSEHVLTIAHNLNRIIESEAKEIEELSYQAGYVSHRLKSHQRYMSELFMTKFQTFPRPRPTIHILRQAIPENQLPRYARRKRPWQRQTGFDYKILDQVGAKRTDGSTITGGDVASPRYGPSGVSSPSGTSSPNGFSTSSNIKPFNPYESAPKSIGGPPNAPSQPPPTQASAKAASAVKPKGPTLFQQSQNSGFGFNSKFSQPPPSFGSIDPNVGSRGPSASVVKYVGGDDDNKYNKPPAPVVPVIPPMGAGGPPPSGGPSAVGGPPQPPQPPQPPPVPNFGASFVNPPQPPAPADSGGPPAPPGPPGPPGPPVPPVPSGVGGPPVPPVPNAAGGPPPAPGPPPPPPN